MDPLTIHPTWNMANRQIFIINTILYIALFRLVVGMLGQAVQNVDTGDAAIAAARTRILTALENAGDDQVAMDFIHGTAFKDCPLGLSVQGNSSQIKLVFACPIQMTVFSKKKTICIILSIWKIVT